MACLPQRVLQFVQYIIFHHRAGVVNHWRETKIFHLPMHMLRIELIIKRSSCFPEYACLVSPDAHNKRILLRDLFSDGVRSQVQTLRHDLVLFSKRTM